MAAYRRPKRPINDKMFKVAVHMILFILKLLPFNQFNTSFSFLSYPFGLLKVIGILWNLLENIRKATTSDEREQRSLPREINKRIQRENFHSRCSQAQTGIDYHRNHSARLLS